MNKSRRKYKTFQLASAILMIVALLWLTVSIPFIYKSQQESRIENLSKQSPVENAEEDCSNPLSDTNEEKAPSTNSFSEEYLHDHHSDVCFSTKRGEFHKLENATAYIAFHGELLVPPPNAS